MQIDIYMANKIDIITDTLALIGGAGSGLLASQVIETDLTQKIITTIICAVVGASVSAVTNYFVKRRLDKK